MVKSHLEGLLRDMKGFKLIETLEVTFEKDTINSKTGKHVSIYKTAFFNSGAKTITKASDIEPELSMSRQEIMNAIDKWVSEGSGWTIDKIYNHYINVTTYQPLHGSSYIELPIELQNSAKGLINIKSKDDECFRWCHIRHLNPQIKHPERIKKGDKQFIEELNYEGIDKIYNHYINVTTYQPLHGSSYIELPIELQNSAKGLINIKSKDDECFRWCHIRHLNPQIKHPERIKKGDKQFIEELNYEGIEFPVSRKHYNKIEKQNSIRINVFGYEKGQPFPIHISEEKFEDQMNLLLITKDEKKHYVLIKDFNAFMYNQSKHKEKKHFCMFCLQCFSSERILVKHATNCLTINGSQAINMPKQGDNILKFNNFHKQLPVPFVIFADFEAIMK